MDYGYVKNAMESLENQKLINHMIKTIIDSDLYVISNFSCMWFTYCEKISTNLTNISSIQNNIIF